MIMKADKICCLQSEELRKLVVHFKSKDLGTKDSSDQHSMLKATENTWLCLHIYRKSSLLYILIQGELSTCYAISTCASEGNLLSLVCQLK